MMIWRLIMAGIDKAAIGFSIAIVAIGVGFAFYMGGSAKRGIAQRPDQGG